ncbi:MAG: tetratricopeptide repeat protein [Candidatus Nanoarchaeia archaeon]|nr:tetratricopeptide repeat protein [Candidatus Nanoarchaeia archaeon]
MFTPTVASYAGKIETAKEEVRKNPDDALAHNNLGIAYDNLGKSEGR